MASAQLALVAVALLASARADADYNKKTEIEARSFDTTSLLSGCLFEDRWYPSGAVLASRESCLRCVCTRSVVSCRRRSCTPLPDPPSMRCHVRHRPENCCPELHCPEGVFHVTSSARNELEDTSEINVPVDKRLACVEGGTLYAAGSAMSSNVACEQCFCLQGAKKCVRPTCLPPPAHCVSRPTSGACCPQRYYCDSEVGPGNSFDCKVDGKYVLEGERVDSATNCSTCFCLKGEVRCQELSCAPPLHGCTPIMKSGECCAHQYRCEHKHVRKESGFHHHHLITHNSLLSSTRNDDRALHMKKRSETSNKKITGDSTKNTPITLATTKVKRKTDETLSVSSEKPHNSTEISNISTTPKATTPAKVVAETTDLIAEGTTEQPEGTVKIVINGTINCTTELSSTSLPLSITLNDTDKVQTEIMPRIPIVNGIEAQTYSPNDIITDRSVNGDFDENDTFTINVTSSLNANTNSTSRPAIATTSKKPVPVDLVNTLNSSKKTKGDYDYDYTEPTLPPSLPNLKIIPFVAADAVVDDESSKEPQTYPILEREDKFPVYYPADTKDTSITRREENYHPTQYPVFISEKDSDYTHAVDLTSHRYPMLNDPLNVHEYTVSTSLGSHMNEAKAVTKAPVTSSTFELETPAVNLFSPPVETEGGFIPKGPGIIDEYYAVYPSTPSGPAVPHLTTSMRLDSTKGDCVSEDGQTIPEGSKFTIECSQCECAWGHLSCTPTLCKAPLGCHFKNPTADSVNQCCGDIVCNTENKTASTSTTIAPTTKKAEAIKTEVKNPIKNETIVTSIQASQLNNMPLQASFQSMNTTDKRQSQDKPLEAPITTPPTRTTISTTKNTTTQKPYTSSFANTTKVTLSSTSTPSTKLTTTLSPTDSKEANDTSSEYEDDDDEGFSFGSVLKLLLSDNYDSTTSSPYKKHTITKPLTKPPLPAIITTKRPPPTVNPFIPLPAMPYNPPKIAPSTVNRIDHLVLGEATAIKRTTPRPITNKTTKKPTEKPTERPDLDRTFTPGLRPQSLDGLSSSDPPGVGAGLLKLAGCNIYGRIYRVGRIIAELSTPCQECWCIEIGVQCNKLEC